MNFDDPEENCVVDNHDSCHVTCGNCNGIEDTDCATCSGEGRIDTPDENGSCPCAPGFYTEDFNNDTEDCTANNHNICDPTCGSCSGTESTECETC